MASSPFGKSSSYRRVVDPFDEVHGAAPDGSHGERAADVIEDAMRTRFPPGREERERETSVGASITAERASREDVTECAKRRRF
jgi:hypothetical protein